MPTCFSVIVSQSTALDEFSKAWSLFHVNYGLGVRVPEGVEPDTVPIPFHITVMWNIQEEDREREVEWRPVVDIDGALTPFASPTSIPTTGTRHRSRVSGFTLPKTGQFMIRAQHRYVGEDEWVTSEAYWPFEFEVNDVSEGEDAVEPGEGLE